MLSKLWQYLTKSGMTRVVIWSTLISTVLTILAFEYYKMLAAVPLSWLISTGAVTLLYCTIRWGHGTDTIARMCALPWFELAIYGLYVVTIIASCFVGWWACGQL